jgi:hypothetical protein
MRDDSRKAAAAISSLFPKERFRRRHVISGRRGSRRDDRRGRRLFDARAGKVAERRERRRHG